ANIVSERGQEILTENIAFSSCDHVTIRVYPDIIIPVQDIHYSQLQYSSLVFEHRNIQCSVPLNVFLRHSRGNTSVKSISELRFPDQVFWPAKYELVRKMLV